MKTSSLTLFRMCKLANSSEMAYQLHALFLLFLATLSKYTHATNFPSYIIPGHIIYLGSDTAVKFGNQRPPHHEPDAVLINNNGGNYPGGSYNPSGPGIFGQPGPGVFGQPGRGGFRPGVFGFGNPGPGVFGPHGQGGFGQPGRGGFGPGMFGPPRPGMFGQPQPGMFNGVPPLSPGGFQYFPRHGTGSSNGNNPRTESESGREMYDEPIADRFPLVDGTMMH